MDARESEAANGAGGAAAESGVNPGLRPADAPAHGEAEAQRHKAGRPSAAASLEERVRSETSQFDFTTLVALGGGREDEIDAGGAQTASRASAISWPLRTAPHDDPESLDMIVPEAFAPPPDRTLKLIVKSVPSAAERRRARLTTGAAVAGAFVLGAAVWGFLPRTHSPAPANHIVDLPPHSARIVDSARVPPAITPRETPQDPPAREAVKTPETPVAARVAKPAARPAEGARRRGSRVTRVRRAAARPSSHATPSHSGFSNHVNSVLNQLP
jgi:hypothetical protein